MGTLYIVSTPIGNLEDITLRALYKILSAKIIICEDTRRTGLLISELKTRYRILTNTRTDNGNQLLIRLDEHTEIQKIPEIISRLTDGSDAVLVSDSGTPLISDPGYMLTREAIRYGISIVSIPGPAAFLTALTASGLPPDKFMFLGYPPAKSSHRIKLFRHLLSIYGYIDSSYIFYEAPHKLHRTLSDMLSVFGQIQIVIGRELTKIHEEVWRGNMTDALSHFDRPKGEFVIIINLSSRTKNH